MNKSVLRERILERLQDLRDEDVSEEEITSEILDILEEEDEVEVFDPIDYLTREQEPRADGS